MKRALVVHHVVHEGLAGFAGPLVDAGYAIERLDVGDAHFAEADFLTPDLLVLLGGPMAVYRRDLFPWIESEVERLADRVIMLEKGRIIADETPAQLIKRFGRANLEEVFLAIARRGNEEAQDEA